MEARLNRRPIVLVGLPGSGKSTVARIVASTLGADCIDLDERIAELAGKSISRIFAEDGEPAFRTLEQTLGGKALEGPPGIVATGGGYMEDPERRRALSARGLVIYLATSPQVAARRIRGGGGGAAGRPLLDGLDPEARLGELLARRDDGYRQAELTVTTDSLTAEDVAAAVVELARERGGW